MLEARQDFERVGWGYGGTRRTGLLDLASIGGAKLEAMQGIDADGVEELTANELDARDRRLGRLDVALDEHDAVSGAM